MLLPPLVAAVLSFLAGILFGLRFAPPASPLLVAAVGVLAYIVVSRSRGAREPPLLLLFVVAGAASGAARAAEVDCRTLIPQGREVRVRGVLGAGIFPDERAPGPPLLPLEHALVVSGTAGCAAPVRVILPDDSPPALAGSRVKISGAWIRSAPAGEESRWPADGYRTGYVRAASVDSLLPPRFTQNPLLTLRGLSEEHLQRLFPDHFAMVEALLLGRRERLDPALRDRFARAGLSHLLAISGSHVAVLAAALLVVGSALRMPRRRIVVLTIVAVLAYLGIIGAPASAVRAGTMISLGLLAALLQRPSAILPIAAAACAVIVALEPLAVLDVGMQLSFAGVLGITTVQRTVGRRLRSASRGRRWRWLGETLLVSTAAFLATAPITAYHFGTIAPVAIPANVPAIPLTGLALVGTLLAAATAPAAPLSRLIASGTGVALDLLDRVATIAANLPFGSAPVDRVRLVPWAIALGVSAAVFLWVRRARTPVRGLVASGVGASFLLVWPAVAAGPARGLELHFLDVGQGDAVALRTPGGRWMLVDAGPRGRDYDAGERRVVPFFRARGVSRIDLLVLTHPDMDHIGGAPAVLRRLRVGYVLEPGLPAGKELYVELLGTVEERGARWLPAREGRSLRIDDVEVTFLWPDSTALAITEANEASAVALIRYGEFTLLLTGDVSTEVEDRLVRRYGAALQADVLKAGHHGSLTSTSAEFLRTVQPNLVVISAGRRNRYGHPAPEVLRRLREARVEIARTDLEGTISLRIPRPDRDQFTRIGE